MITLPTRKVIFFISMKTAESVTFAHPDKVCDQISDAILDACLTEDLHSRVAIEVMGGHGMVAVMGELTTHATVDIQRTVMDTYRACGYEDDVEIITRVEKQSPEIGSGVDKDGAGDQGIMVGYATSETPELMPLEFSLARTLTDAMGAHDGKSQVTLNEEGKIARIITSLSSNGKDDDVRLEETAKTLEPLCAAPLETVWMKNPNGPWTLSGFHADSGLTGRKVIVDTYGPRVPAGGGAFSGKDATKVDRSAAYMARKAAVEVLREKGAKEVRVEVAYAIGVAEPVMLVAFIDGKSEKLTGYDFRPQAIIETLDLRKPQFLETAKRGHFGRGWRWDS